jgi:hypothetical protein
VLDLLGRAARFILNPQGDPAPRPLAERARELRSVYYDPETCMFREPWKMLDYPVLKFLQWRIESGDLVGDGPIYSRLATRAYPLAKR